MCGISIKGRVDLSEHKPQVYVLYNNNVTHDIIKIHKGIIINWY